ncbi:MAG: hypothetical protein GQ574_14785 [Crocinitomix sp.]|nr:hypothetical protein [Crocinitomix sp.]
MNNLSWLLYLADVVPNLGEFAMLYLPIAGVLGTVFLMMGHDTKVFKPPVKTHITLLIIAAVITVASPSKQTIYLIAGSEAGEAVVTSTEGQEVIDDIKAIIKTQLEGMK